MTGFPRLILVFVLGSVPALTSQFASAQSASNGVELDARLIPAPAPPTVSEELAMTIASQPPLTDFDIPTTADGWIKLRSEKDRAFIGPHSPVRTWHAGCVRCPIP